MRFTMIVLLALGAILSSAVLAFNGNENENFLSLNNTNGRQELKNLKEIHNYNEVFDNYHLGGIAPDTPSQKGE